MQTRKDKNKQGARMSKGEGNRWLGAGLIFVGVLGLGASTYISWRFGWSLAEAEADRYASAGIHALADVTSAMLILAGACMWVWGWYVRAVLSVAISLLFMTYGFFSAFGFFSNRISVSEAQKAAASVDKDYLKWVQGQTVNMDLPRSQRLAMMAEVKAGRDTLKSTAGIISDKQAASVGKALGWTTEQTQTRLTAATSGIAYGVKFSGLWIGGMIWARRRKSETDRKISSTPEGSGGKVKSEPATVKQDEKVVNFPAAVKAEPAQLQASPKVSAEPPRVTAPAPKPSLKFSGRSLAEILADQPSWSSSKALAVATGKSEATVSRELRKLEGRGRVKRERKGRSVQITSLRRNGGLHAVI